MMSEERMPILAYREDGITRSGEEWFSHGRHRTDGPGHVAYNKKGEPVKETWFSPNGEPIDSPRFQRHNPKPLGEPVAEGVEL